jgi:hypothetical protein
MYKNNNAIQKCEYSKMWVAILVSKDMMELLSLISVGKEFQMCAPRDFPRQRFM